MTKPFQLACELKFNFYANIINMLHPFLACNSLLLTIGYIHNLLISNHKGATWHVYPPRHPSTPSERLLIHPPWHRARSVVRLCLAGVYRSFYQFHLFEHSSVHQHSFRPEREPTPILYVHGVKQASMAQTVDAIVEYDSKPANR